MSFGKTTAYKCSDGKVLTPNKKELIADFKARVKEHEIVAQIIKKLGEYFPASGYRDAGILANRTVKLKQIAEYRNDLVEALKEENYNVKI